MLKILFFVGLVASLASCRQESSTSSQNHEKLGKRPEAQLDHASYVSKICDLLPAMELERREHSTLLLTMIQALLRHGRLEEVTSLPERIPAFGYRSAALALLARSVPEKKATGLLDEAERFFHLAAPWERAIGVKEIARAHAYFSNVDKARDWAKKAGVEFDVLAAMNLVDAQLAANDPKLPLPAKPEELINKVDELQVSQILLLWGDVAASRGLHDIALRFFSLASLYSRILPLRERGFEHVDAAQHSLKLPNGREKTLQAAQSFLEFLRKLENRSGFIIPKAAALADCAIAHLVAGAEDHVVHKTMEEAFLVAYQAEDRDEPELFGFILSRALLTGLDFGFAEKTSNLLARASQCGPAIVARAKGQVYLAALVANRPLPETILSLIERRASD